MDAVLDARNDAGPEMMASVYESSKGYVQAYEEWREHYDGNTLKASRGELLEALEKMLNLAATCAFHVRRLHPSDRNKVDQAVKRAEKEVRR